MQEIEIVLEKEKSSEIEIKLESETTTHENLTEELNTYNTELTEQETLINRIIEALKSK